MVQVPEMAHDDAHMPRHWGRVPEFHAHSQLKAFM